MAEQIAVIVLAAGMSRRMGSPKQLLEYQGRTLLQHAVETALGLVPCRLIVVLGAANDAVGGVLDGRVHAVINEEWQEGMASSIRKGIAAMGNADAALVMVCDQPYVTTELLEQLVDKHMATGLPIIAAEYGGKPGTPALFHRTMFPQLLELRGDKGAKQLIMDNAEKAAFLGFPDGITDIDTPADYEALRGRKTKE